MKARKLFTIALASAALAGAADAQVTVLLGAGRPVKDSGPLALNTSNVHLGLQVDIPLMPVAFRAEGMVAGSDITNAPRSIFASLILPLRAPVVQPYGILSYGAYSFGKSTEVRGVNYGAGVRLGVTRLGLFGEVRRHEKLNRTMATIGITL